MRLFLKLTRQNVIGWSKNKKENWADDVAPPLASYIHHIDKHSKKFIFDTIDITSVS